MGDGLKMKDKVYWLAPVCALILIVLFAARSFDAALGMAWTD